MDKKKLEENMKQAAIVIDAQFEKIEKYPDKDIRLIISNILMVLREMNTRFK